MPDDSGGESAVPSVDFQLISLSRAVRGLNTVVTRDDILQSPSLIRTTIAPAFGIQDTSHVLSIMASAGFVTTLDVGIKLVTLAGLMRTNGHLIISGSTGTGDETCASVGAHFRSRLQTCTRDRDRLVMYDVQARLRTWCCCLSS
jgi:hypothetical protein